MSQRIRRYRRGGGGAIQLGVSGRVIAAVVLLHNALFVGRIYITAAADGAAPNVYAAGRGGAFTVWGSEVSNWRGTPPGYPKGPTMCGVTATAADMWTEGTENRCGVLAEDVDGTADTADVDGTADTAGVDGTTDTAGVDGTATHDFPRRPCIAGSVDVIDENSTECGKCYVLTTDRPPVSHHLCRAGFCNGYRRRVLVEIVGSIDNKMEHVTRTHDLNGLGLSELCPYVCRGVDIQEVTPFCVEKESDCELMAVEALSAIPYFPGSAAAVSHPIPVEANVADCTTGRLLPVDRTVPTSSQIDDAYSPTTALTSSDGSGKPWSSTTAPRSSDGSGKSWSDDLMFFSLSCAFVVVSVAGAVAAAVL